jgi:hypothetical protein
LRKGARAAELEFGQPDNGKLSRRHLLAATAAGGAFVAAKPAGAASFGNPEPAQGAINMQANPASAADFYQLRVGGDATVLKGLTTAAIEADEDAHDARTHLGHAVKTRELPRLRRPRGRPEADRFVRAVAHDDA